MLGYRALLPPPLSGGVHLYRGPEVCRLAGVTYRQLDYWDRSGLAGPTYPARGSGMPRVYTCRDLLVLRILGATRHRGIALRYALDVAAALADHADTLDDGAVLVIDDAGARVVPPGDPPGAGIAILIPLDPYRPACCYGREAVA
jgi:hypothetical protein